MKLRMRTLNNIFLAILVLVLLSIFVYAVPEGLGTITVGSNDRKPTNAAGTEVQAQAGNVTELKISASRISNYWQGYYGNITGTITLDDANNYTLYDWNLPSPSGEIYAANSTVTSWTAPVCINLSSNRPGYNCTFSEAEGINSECLNATEIEAYYGMDSSITEGINETFTKLMNITVGSVSLTQCAATTLYVNNTNQSQFWKEAMISINNTETIIFASILEDNYWGFNNKTWDFQMIVAEKNTTGTSTYYFYVELT